MGRSSADFNSKRCRNEMREVRNEQNEYLDISFLDIPSNIVENIILRLSIKRIAICKCVCKTWCEIISDRDFAKLHFDRGQICPLLQSSNATSLSRMLYLVQEEKVGFIEPIHDRCDTKHPHYRCRVEVKLDTKFRIPLCNFANIQKNEDDPMKLQMKDHNYRVVNSCNGLLCLANPLDNDPVIVWNPVTGEFINIPKVRTTRHRLIASGFGVSHTTNQYKVVRVFLDRERQVAAKVHVLGAKSWRGVQFHRFYYRRYNLFPTSLNGSLYWLTEYFVTCFDIDTECFGIVSVPPLKANAPYINRHVGMGMLVGELSITEVSINDVNVWTMNGGENCWSKLFSFPVFGSFQIWPYGSLQPIKYHNDGPLLMFNSRINGFMYKDPKKDGFKYIRVRGINSRMEAIPHSPSFVLLKDILVGRGVRVLNVNSRCGALKLHNESKVVPYLKRIIRAHEIFAAKVNVVDNSVLIYFFLTSGNIFSKS